MTHTPEGKNPLEVDAAGKMYAPSAERNKAAIADVLADCLPPSANVLEIASGTGQHVTHFASCFPSMTFQPTDRDPARRASITAYIAEANATNITQPITLDAAQAGWSTQLNGFDAVIIVNLLHLVSEQDARTILSEAAQALSPAGHLILYGPFMRGGELTSDGDIAFHTQLSTDDPTIGYKDDFDVIDWLQDAWLEMRHVLEMPANNLCLIAQKP